MDAFLSWVVWLSLWHVCQYVLTGWVLSGGVRTWPFHARDSRYLAFNVVVVGPALAAWWLPTERLTWDETDQWRLLAATLLYDAAFWGLHGLVHTVPWLYRHVHKHHHRWVTTDHAWSALDSHPVEHACVNVLPLVGLLFALGVSQSAALAYLAYGTFNTQWAHALSTGAHAHHHRNGKTHWSFLPGYVLSCAECDLHDRWVSHE